MRLAPVLIIALLFTCAFGHRQAQAQAGQSNSADASHRLPDAPSAAAKPDATPPAPSRSFLNPAPTHRFWDRENILLFSGVAVVRVLDYTSTKNFLARGRTEVLIPDDIVNNSAGFAALEATGTATSVGLSYILHRTGHHKMERWLSIGHIGVTAFGDAHNYALKSKHP
jgi:hypothetical protein